MIPKIYYGNQWAQGVLSGELNTPTNPVRRAADGSINLVYAVTSGGDNTGWMAVTLPTAVAPDALVMPLGAVVSGHRFILESEDVGGGNNATILDFTISGTADRFVREFTGATPRRVWRLIVSGFAGAPAMSMREMQLATLLTFPRSNEVGVTRTRVRQFTRLPIPGGQPYVKRDGPILRKTRWVFTVVSGVEIDSLQNWVEAVEGGESFTLIDDLGQTYWGELLGQEQPFPDEAGVYRMDISVQEIRAD